jgi:hypothetical protein
LQNDLTNTFWEIKVDLKEDGDDDIHHHDPDEHDERLKKRLLGIRGEGLRTRMLEGPIYMWDFKMCTSHDRDLVGKEF